MNRNTEVLIAGRSDTELTAIKAAIDSLSGIGAESFLMVNGHTDPLAGAHDKPDVLILHTGDRISDTLQSLCQRPLQDLPPVLLYGDELPPEAVRFAVRAGVRDVVSSDEPQELVNAVNGLVLELAADHTHDRSRVVAVMNAKGGSGATFLATTIAHLAATSASGDTIVVDLDFQFGSLPHYLDISPKRSLLEALSHVNELDGVAIEAYVAEHSSGLSIMAPLPDTPCGADFDISDRLKTLLPLLRSRYRNIIVDVPRHIDLISTPVLEQADHVLLVLQQSLPSVRDAVRLKTTLVRELGIPADRLHAVVNRHLKAGSIELQDIREALGEEQLTLVPNHFKAVGQAIDMGMPIVDVAPSSPVVKALTALQSRLLAGDGHTAAHPDPKGTAIERLKQWSPF